MWLPTGMSWHGKLGSVGLSEYKRNFKWKPSEQPRLCSSTHEQKCRWAGLRSDEFGITREPNFISKRRVPYYDTQISKSFQWNGGNGLEKDVLSELEVSEPVKLHKTDSKDVELNKDSIETSDSPRLPEKLHLNSAGSGPESTEALRKSKKSVPQTPVHENKILAATKKELGKTDHGLNRVLQRRAGMNISRSRSFPRSSEYQREFVWKTPQKLSPVLAADQFIHRSSQSIPPFKSPVIIPETEYERNFKPSPPVKQLKQCFLEESECPRSESVEISSGEKNEKNKTTSKTPEDSNQNELETKQKEEKQNQKLLCSHRHSKKMNTEYRSKFLSPSQYIYKQGAWVHVRKNIPYQGSQNTLNTMWYVEVKELREKAEAYKQRIQGTHFSRDHLNQILSDSNRLWDLSSESTVEETMSNNIRALDLAGIPENKLSSGPKILAQPAQQNSTGNLGVSDALTIPVKRRLVWDESHDDEQQENLSPILGECKEEENKQEIGEVKEVEKNDKDASINNQQNSSEGRADSSESLRARGRLPTPQLRTLGGIQRTHHDLTTPAAGGAVLVSPEKGKHSSLLQIEKESSEKQYLGNSQVSREQIKGKTNTDEEKTVTDSSVAGLKTLDPLPLQIDQYSNQDTSGKRNCATLMHSEQIPIVSETKLSKASAVPYWSPFCRIQGSLRDPEFQHNGNIASPKRSWLQLPLQERNYHDEDDDDRLSQLSARSAASGSLASQVLERAQRRKENFWGKM
ncbi:nuclear protein MDM1 isoform X1 [Pantherophis guttatus]|uniref:Nuclear protein MDM1 n=1 Tax=Pantherophis guttatus TaxID=94885 RepID=A0A6P9ALJ5_PANGU|nr:nuclear protein MDM1 isoform X1 [Pantherophis guttatus]